MLCGDGEVWYNDCAQRYTMYGTVTFKEILDI